MNTVVLVDTDILIDAARHDHRAVAFLASTRAVERFLGDHFEVVPLDAAISARALDLLKTYRLSHGLLIPDALIAATAQVAAQEFATKNRSDFHFIGGLRLLDYRA